MRRLFTTSVCLALLTMALLCTVAPAAATNPAPAGDTYPFIRNATYPNGTAWQIGLTYGIAINTTGYIFITQMLTAPHIRVFDPAGNEVARWNKPSIDSRFTGIAADSQNVYVADNNMGLLRVYSLSGVLVRDVSTGAESYPSDVSVNSTGYVFVMCRDSVQVISPGGGTATTFVSGLTGSYSVAVNSTDYLYVDRSNSEFIDIFDRDGNEAGHLELSSASFAPRIAFDALDNVFSTDYATGRFDGNSRTGTYLGTSQAGYLKNPTGIAVTASGEAYVLNLDRGNVSIFRVRTPPTPTPSGSASFAAYPQSGPAPHLVQFLDYTPNAKSWSWEFGDGGSSTLQYPTHQYNQSGLYSVTLTVTDWAGHSSTKTEYQFIHVSAPVTPAPTPVADFSANVTSGPAPMTVAFTDESTPSPYHRWWTFGDGASSTDANPVHTYTKAGTYTVNLTAWTAIGTASTSKSAYITVGADPRAPVANFTMSRSSGMAPLYVRFTDASTNATSGRWSFGGLAWTTARSPSVIFRQPGEYAVTLTATNAFGSSTATKNVTVTGAMPRSVRGSAVSVVG